MSPIANRKNCRYSAAVAANSATGFSRPNIVRRKSATAQKAGAFFMPVISFYGGCAWDTFGYAGCLTSRSANPRTATTQIRLAANGGSSSTSGATPMTTRRILSLNPSKFRAAAHRAMALAALHANSSLSVRLKRYNAHMQIVRALESGEVAA